MDNRFKCKENVHLTNRIERLEEICEDQKLKIEQLVKEMSSCKQILCLLYKNKREIGIERCRKTHSWLNHRLYSCCSAQNPQNPGTETSFDEVD